MADRLTLMAVHAHPDDECMGTGGVLARYSNEGLRTVLVTATRGEEGEIVDPELNAEVVQPRLGDVRLEELRCSCRHLGVQELHILGYRDSGMAGTPANAHPECLAQADLQEATGRLVRLIREIRPHVLTCYDAKGGYGHPDHIQVHRLTVAAFHAAGNAMQYPNIGPAPWQPQKLYYMAYPRSYILTRYEIMRAMGESTPLDRPDFDPNKVGTPDETITTHVDIHPYLDHKREALRCHRTQVSRDWWYFHVPPEIFHAHFSQEYFVRMASHVPVNGSEHDLFAGLR